MKKLLLMALALCLVFSFSAAAGAAGVATVDIPEPEPKHDLMVEDPPESEPTRKFDDLDMAAVPPREFDGTVDIGVVRQ